MTTQLKLNTGKESRNKRIANNVTEFNFVLLLAFTFINEDFSHCKYLLQPAGGVALKPPFFPSRAECEYPLLSGAALH